MTLRIHDTLRREKVTFEPRNSSDVRMYVCGPTVYDFAHIGNARPVVVFDVLFRLLRDRYGKTKVRYVRNTTDIDDKIIEASQKSGERTTSITNRMTRIFQQDMAALGALPPTRWPRATRNIRGMIELVNKLLESGHAYEAKGHVLFEVGSWPGYGKLSRHDRDAIIAGARVEVAPYKRDPADFVLWKPSPDKSLPGWESDLAVTPENPRGRGRPGWHLECSAMSERYFGPEFDIHGGGQDLIFPHHENEIAQSTCTGNSGFAKYWMHNGYLMAEGEKMSKSLGNFYTVRDLLAEFPGEAIRLALLKTHYRQPLDFTKEGLAEAKRELDGFYGALRGTSLDDLDYSNLTVANDFVQNALEDDLNTPDALHYLHIEAGEIFKSNDRLRQQNQRSLRKSAHLLGLLQQDPEAWFKWQPPKKAGEAESHDDAAINALITERNDARAARDFARADAIRDELESQGILLEDSASGTTWKRG